MAHFWINESLPIEEQPTLNYYRLLKAFYITSAIVRLLNIALLLLFFYMASQFKGKLLTSYKESFERLQNLQIWAEKEDFHSMRNKHTMAPWKRSLK